MTRKGPWSTEQIEGFLRATRIPVRVACNGMHGSPLLASLWFAAIDGQLWCATQRSARIVSLLERDPRCAFEVSVETPPYRGVRGRGMARIDSARGEEILRLLIERYLRDVNTPPAPLLLSRVETEVAIAIKPQSITSWDYSERMAGAA